MRALIVLNGDLPPEAHKLLLDDDFIICTDGGARHLIPLGRVPNAIIGDMDSITPELKARYKDKLIVHDGQDFSDAEKALHLAIKMGFDSIAFLAFEGSRLDHLLSVVMLLREYKEKDITLLSKDYDAVVVHKEISLKAKKGARISLIALDDVAGITTKGLKYPLLSARLQSSTHGVSNEATAENVHIKVDEGALLVLRWNKSEA